jgi:hypothetical protein
MIILMVYLISGTSNLVDLWRASSQFSLTQASHTPLNTIFITSQPRSNYSIGDTFVNMSPDYLTGLPLNHPMDGDVNMNEAKRLIDVCLGTHKACGRNKMPRYTALSYCWGREPQYVTTNSNFEFMC